MSAAPKAGWGEDEPEPAVSGDAVLAREIWNAVPPAIRRYIEAYEVLFHRGGTAILMDKGTRPGGSYVAYSPAMDFCDRDIHQWIRHCERTHAALVVLTGPGDYAPASEPLPATGSVLVFCNFRGDDFRDRPEANRWALRVPVLESNSTHFPHDCIVLNENLVADTLSGLPQRSQATET